MRLHDLVSRHSSLALQTINVLSEELQQQPLVVQQLYEGMRYRRPVFARIQFMCECVEGERIVAEVADIEDCLSVW